MNVKILYDNEAKEGFKCGWGFAALVDDDTLFDTGENAGRLLVNMRAFNVQPQQIKQVVLSHEDWDHAGGIAVLKDCGSVNVYVPAGVPSPLKKLIHDLNPSASVFEALLDTTIDADKFVTATLGSDKKEISLAVRTNKGLVLLTGCAHPGLENIVAYVHQSGDIHAVIGGFHGFNKLEALKDVPVIVPCHCTQHRQDILNRYPEQTHFGAAGIEIHLEEKR